MNLLIFLGLAGLILINACSDNPAKSNEDLSSSRARDQLLEKVSKVDLSNPGTVLKLLPGAATFDTLEWNATTGKANVPGGKAPLTGWAKGIHPNGKLEGIGHFIDGKENGPCFFWRADGTKDQQGGFLGGKRHGLWIHWDGSGKETKREHWDEDKLLKKILP